LLYGRAALERIATPFTSKRVPLVGVCRNLHRGENSTGSTPSMQNRRFIGPLLPRSGEPGPRHRATLCLVSGHIDDCARRAGWVGIERVKICPTDNIKTVLANAQQAGKLGAATMFNFAVDGLS